MTADSTLAARFVDGVEDPFRPRTYVVRTVRKEAAGTVTLVLDPSDGETLAFRPGQFTMLGRPGHAEVPISVSGDPAHPERLEHTVRAAGRATQALVASEPGDRVLVRGPYGRGWDVEDGAGGDVVIVAGGIGLAPLRPVVLDVLAHRGRYGRVVLVYGARRPDQLLYRHELEHWRGRFDVEVSVTVDVSAPRWRGRVGLVTSLLPREGLDGGDVLAMVCGPEVMMRLSADALVDRGVPAGQVRVSLERNMKCGVGLCGHCQLRELFVCVDGPVAAFDRVRPLLMTREL